MILLETERLSIQEFQPKDKAFFIELLSAPEIINPVPQSPWPLEKIEKQFQAFAHYPSDLLTEERVAWGIYEKGGDELIGLYALLTNDEQHKELGYRFRKPFWGKGYATETTRGMIDFCFKTLPIDLLTADVNVDNIGSVKVLEKFFLPVREFYNEGDGCTDRRYHLTREYWLGEKN